MTNRETLHAALDRLELSQDNALCSLLFGCSELAGPILAPCECCSMRDADDCAAHWCEAHYRDWLDREAMLREAAP